MKTPEVVLYLFSFAFVSTQCNEVKYIPKITDSVYECDNFENKILDCSGLVLGSTKGEEGDNAAKLGGIIETMGEIISDFDVEIDVWKMLEMGNEFMYTTRANFCSSLSNSDAPWYPVIQSMNISACPVPINSFEVAEMTVSLECVKDVMCHDFVGEYRIDLSIMDKATKLSCHVIEICITEEESDE